MEAVNKAKTRLRKYPVLVAQCRESGIAYADCVLSRDNVRKGDCQKEFDKFKACLVKAAAKANTRL